MITLIIIRKLFKDLSEISVSTSSNPSVDGQVLVWEYNLVFYSEAGLTLQSTEIMLN